MNIYLRINLSNMNNNYIWMMLEEPSENDDDATPV